MFYDKFKSLCKEKGVSCNRAAIEIGLSNATPTTWKKRGLTPKADTLAKIADYFGVSVDSLLDSETAKSTGTNERQISDNDIMFALWGDTKDVDKDDLEDVKRYAAFVRERKKKK